MIANFGHTVQAKTMLGFDSDNIDIAIDLYLEHSY